MTEPTRLARNLRRRVAAERADRCGMPVGYGQTCHLPADHPHENGCTWPRTDGGPSLREYLASKGER